MTPELGILPASLWRQPLQDLAAKLEDTPAGVAPWSFHGSDLKTTETNWKECRNVIVPVAFNALATREWETLYGMTAPEQKQFFDKFNKLCEIFLQSLPSLHDPQKQYIYIQWGDLKQDLPCLNRGRIFKVSCSKTSHSEAMPYFIDDLEEQHLAGTLSLLPIQTQETLHCSFIGNLSSHPLRERLRQTIHAIDPKQFTINLINTAVDQQARQRKEYLQSILESQFVLCPRGGGLNSARFFEALALGRIPILIGDETKLPMENQIDYDQFIIRAPENSLNRLIDLMKKFYHQHGLIEASKCAYSTYWNRLQYNRFFRHTLANGKHTYQRFKHAATQN